MDHSSEHSPSESGAAGSPVDLSQFHQIFFEEAAENLDQLEQLLLSLDLKAADDEELNALFRCAHSIKGGAATFGFADMAQLTHHMESLLDGLRWRKCRPASTWWTRCWQLQTPAAPCWVLTRVAVRWS